MPRAPKSGFLVAAALLVAGAATAGVAWWYNFSHTKRSLEFWGPPAAALIRDATQVTAHRVVFGDSVASASEVAPVEPTDTGLPLVHPVTHAPATVLETRDISRAKGLAHLRHALLDDLSFAWTERLGEVGDVAYVLTFEEAGSRLVIFFSGDFTALTTARPGAGGPATVSTRPIAEGLRTYFADVFP